MLTVSVQSNPNISLSRAKHKVFGVNVQSVFSNYLAPMCEIIIPRRKRSGGNLACRMRLHVSSLGSRRANKKSHNADKNNCNCKAKIFFVYFCFFHFSHLKLVSQQIL